MPHNHAEALMYVLLLLVVSLLVRVLPAFFKPMVSERTLDEIKTLLPIAVFVNLMVYCAMSELRHAALSALAGLALLTLLIVSRRVNLLVMVVLATGAYLAVPAG